MSSPSFMRHRALRSSTAVFLAVVLLTATPPRAMSAPSAIQESPSASDDLGKIGPTWPIAEHDLLDLMLARVRHKQEDGEASQLEDQLHQRADAYIDHPPSLNLPRATQDTARTFDPTLVLPYDIHDAKGKVLWPKGTRVNPLEHRSFDEALLFVDGDDPTQVDWLRHRLATDQQPALHDKIILTGGSPAHLAKQLKLSHPAYFDQGGRLVGKFGIEAVPATVAADPDAPRQRLLIRTYDPLEQNP